MSDISMSNRLSYERVVVPLDGSSFAEVALDVARQVGASLGARIDLAGFGVQEADEAALQRRLLDVAADYPEAHIWTGVDRHVAEGIAEVAGAEEPSLVCMASHARHGLPGALLHSVAMDVLGQRAQPLLLVGPGYEPSRRLGSGPVVAAVDGTPGSHAVLAPAAAWAAQLGVGLHVVTVAEPVPPPVGRHTLRHHGPGDDPEGYVEGLAAPFRGPDLDVTAIVVYDPVSVAGALCDYIDGARGSLIVVANQPHGAVSRSILGSTTIGVLRATAVPVLVVPRPDPVRHLTAEHPGLGESLGTVVHGLGSSGI